MNVPPAPNLHIKIITEKNPWENKDSRPTLPPLGILLLCVVIIVCAVYPIVASRFPSLWFVPLLLAALFYIRANRTPYGWLLLIAAFALSWFFSGGSLIVAGTVVCLITVLTLTAFLHTILRHPLLLVLPVLSYGAALLLCADPIAALVSLLAYPAAYVMGRKTLQNDPRVGVICATALTLGGMLLLWGALLWRLSGVEMSMQIVTQTLTAFRNEILSYALNDAEFAEMRELFSGMGYPIEASFAQILDLLLLLIPGCAVILAFLPCYAAQYLLTMTYTAMGMKEYSTVAARRFIMSVLSALLFVISSIVMLFPGDLNMFTAVSQNLWLILFPGMSIAGFWSLYASFRARPAPVYLILAIVLGCIMPQLLLLFVALSGATATLTRPLLLKIAAITAAQNGQNGTPHDHDDENEPPAPPSN